MSTLAILISSHNRADLLERTLHHLNQAAPPPSGWSVEILVAANACNDRTHALLDRYVAESRSGAVAGGQRTRLPLRWVAEPRAGKSFALNCAIPLLTSELVAFVDDDHRVDKRYLEAVCLAAMEYPDADILCGRILPDWNGSEPTWVHDDGPYRIYPLPVPRYDLGEAPLPSPQDTTSPGGGNLVLRTALFARVGEFSTSYGPVGRSLGGAEDHEWVGRAVASGARIQYVPQIVQYHYVDPTRLELGYVMRKAFERSASAVRLGGATAGHGIVPAYMFRKTGEYGWGAMASTDQHRRRFYFVRLAAALGEIKGHLHARIDRARS